MDSVEAPARMPTSGHSKLSVVIAPGALLAVVVTVDEPNMDDSDGVVSVEDEQPGKATPKMTAAAALRRRLVQTRRIPTLPMLND